MLLSGLLTVAQEVEELGYKCGVRINIRVDRERNEKITRSQYVILRA